MIKIISMSLVNADDPTITAVDIQAKGYVPLPAQFSQLTNADAIAKTVDPDYAVKDGKFIFSISGAYQLSQFQDDAAIKADLIAKYNAGVTKLDNFPLIPQLTMAGTEWDGTSWTVSPIVSTSLISSPLP